MRWGGIDSEGADMLARLGVVTSVRWLVREVEATGLG